MISRYHFVEAGSILKITWYMFVYSYKCIYNNKIMPFSNAIDGCLHDPINMFIKSMTKAIAIWSLIN